MRVLIACEHSGIVREAFAALGHDAWSCDLLPTLQPGQHLQCDVREVLRDGWDLLIAHPPCQYLTYAGIRWWNEPGRAEKREAAMRFFMELVSAPIPRICIENPRGYPYQAYRKPDQVIHPYYFGDREMKRSALWLKNLPKLYWYKQPDLFGSPVAAPRPEPTGYYSASSKQPGKARWWTNSGFKNGLQRSRTFPSVAAAMASQWSALGRALRA